MSNYNIEVRQYSASDLPPIDLKEVWRYTGSRQIPSEGPLADLMDEILSNTAA